MVMVLQKPVMSFEDLRGPFKAQWKQSSPHHLLECDLHQVFESFIRVLLCGLLHEAVLQHVNHLLPGDVVVTVHVVHLKAVWAVKIKVINLGNCVGRNSVCGLRAYI